MVRTGRGGETEGRALKTVNLDEAVLRALRDRQDSSESYSDTVNRYLWMGIEAEADTIEAKAKAKAKPKRRA